MRRGDPADPVRYPGPRGEHCESGRTRQPGSSLRCEHRRLLVPDIDDRHRRGGGCFPPPEPGHPGAPHGGKCGDTPGGRRPPPPRPPPPSAPLSPPIRGPPPPHTPPPTPPPP